MNRLLAIKGAATISRFTQQWLFNKIRSGEIAPAWTWKADKFVQYSPEEGTENELYIFEEDILRYIKSRPAKPQKKERGNYATYPQEPHDETDVDSGIPVPFSVAANWLGVTYGQLRGIVAREEIGRWGYTPSGVYMRKYRPGEEEKTDGRPARYGRAVYIFEKDIREYQERHS